MHHHRNIILLLLSFLALFEGYLSCSCLRTSLQAQVTGAKNVFRGKVLKQTQSQTEKIYTVQIKRSCRLENPSTVTGELNNIVQVRTGTHSCGVLGLEDNKEYTFLTDSKLEISLCQWNGEAEWDRVEVICRNTNPGTPDIAIDPPVYAPHPPIFEPRPPTYPSYPRPQEPNMSLKEVERRVCEMCTRLQKQNRRQEPSSPLVDPVPVEIPHTSCSCPEIYSPICGHNGVTYSNECEARCNSVGIKHSGACKLEPDTPQNSPPRNEDRVPTCTCPRILRLVCGQSGTEKRTFTNSCESECVGFKVIHEGACRDENDPNTPVSSRVTTM